MAEEDLPDKTIPSQVGDFIKNWKELITTIAAGIAATLGGHYTEERLRIVLWIAAAIITIVGAVVSVLAQRRKKEIVARVKSWERSVEQQRANSAFRGLSAFEQGDELPGAD